jgi:hypothetical protein
MRYGLQYLDPELNGAMTYTVRLVDPQTKRVYRDARFNLLDEDASLAFCRQCAGDLAGGGEVPLDDRHADALMTLLTRKVAEVHRTSPTKGSERRLLRGFKPFPTHLLPEPIARYVREAAASLGCDESFVALPVLVLLGSAIGTTRRILLKRTWREYPIIWCVIVAASGAKKSPPFDLALAPLQKLQREAYRRWERELVEYEAALQSYERDLSQFRKSKGGEEPPVKPEVPVLDHLIVSDTTVEALAPILKGRPRGVMLYRDELSGWLAGMNQYKARGGADSAHWLEMFGGRSLKVDRKGGMPLLVPRAAVWVTGSIQPRTLQRCLGDEHFDNGMAARPLYAFPPRRKNRWSDRELDLATEAGLNTIVQRLLGLSFNVMPDGDEVPIDTPLSSAAKRIWVQFVNDHGEEQFTLGESSLAAAWSKLEGYAARLALIIHFIRWACDDPTLASGDEVDEASIQAGIGLSRWFGGEAERLYGVMRESEEEADRRELVELLRHLGGRVTVRQLGKHARRYQNAADATAALMSLVDTGLARVHRPAPSAKGGRPTQIFELIEPADEELDLEAVDSADVTETPAGDAASGVLSTGVAENGGLAVPSERVLSTPVIDKTPAPIGSKPAFAGGHADKTPRHAAESGVSVTSTPAAIPKNKSSSPIVEVEI